MRVRIEVSEPASLEIEEGGKIEFSGELRDLHSGDEGVVDLDEGARLAGFQLERLILRPRYVEESLQMIEEGRSVTVDSVAYPKQGSPIGFTGVASMIQGQEQR